MRSPGRTDGSAPSVTAVERLDRAYEELDEALWAAISPEEARELAPKILALNGALLALVEKWKREAEERIEHRKGQV